MAGLKVSKKSQSKHSTLYRWNGHFGHLTKSTKLINTGFGHFGLSVKGYGGCHAN